MESELDSKGMGIQSLAVTASLLWLQQFYRKRGRSVIWLIEEPEFFLHPSLMSAQLKILTKLSEEASVLYSTHSLSFIPGNKNDILGIKKDDNKTHSITYRSTYDATKSIAAESRSRLSHFFNLTEYTIGVEGPSDKKYLEWFLTKYSVATPQHEWPLLRGAVLVDYGGIQPLQYFLQSMYDYIKRESVYVAIFDSDEAGIRARSALQSYFDNKYKFSYESGIDFVSICRGYSIEGLFSDRIIKDVYAKSRELFLGYSVDAAGDVEPFRLRDECKSDAFEKLTMRADIEEDFDWADRFIQVCSALEEALRRQKERLGRLS